MPATVHESGESPSETATGDLGQRGSVLPSVGLYREWHRLDFGMS